MREYIIETPPLASEEVDGFMVVAPSLNKVHKKDIGDAIEYAKHLTEGLSGIEVIIYAPVQRLKIL
jgi:hypothetical protein